MEAFPGSFQDDVADFIARVSGQDLLREDAPVRPFAPATIRHRREQMRRFATALVIQGLAAADITDLGLLVQPDNFRCALRFMLDRNGGETSGAIHGAAMAMKSIARHHVGVDDETLDALKGICRKLDPGRGGLSDKNRHRLRQFDDPRNVELLLDLPRRLVAEARKRPDRDRRAALLVQIALAIEILLMCPLRLRNLAGLNLDRHFQRSRAARDGVCHLVIGAEEVKNRQPLEFELPDDAVSLLDLYADHYLARLTPTPSRWLFPGKDAFRHKKPGCLSLQISREVFRLTGLEVHVHLFRHIGAKIYLDAHPGGYEVVRRVLGHRSMDTTVDAYTGLESAAAMRHFDQQILTLRRDVPGKGRRRLKPKRKGAIR